jgi:WD40 repeat protein
MPSTDSSAEERQPSQEADRSRPRRTGQLDVAPSVERRTASYDAFISYSHRTDRDLARSLERTLQTFGARWYQLRGVRTYRDETNLAAEPALWPAIERAVRGSRCLVLLASPESARSEWVPQEVAAALDAHGINGLCIAQTDGVLPWTDRIPADEVFARADGAIGASVCQIFSEAGAQPLVVDLRPFRVLPERERRRSPEYLSNAASIAAKALGEDKETLWGEYHRAVRLRTGLLIVISLVLATLFVIAVAMTVKAGRAASAEREARDKAEHAASAEREARDEAERARKDERSARIASDSRELASRAVTLLEQRPQVALLLAAEALQATRRAGEPTVDVARRTLEQTLREIPSWPFPAGTPKYVSSTAVGRRIVTFDGAEVSLWTASLDGEVEYVAKFSSEGRTIDHPHQGRWLVAWKENELRLFDLASRTPGAIARSVPGRYVTISPDASWLVTLQNRQPSLWSLDSTSSQPVKLPTHYGKQQAIVFSHDSRRLITADADGRPRVWPMPPGHSDPLTLPKGRATHTVRFSRDGRWLLVSDSDATSSGSPQTDLWHLGRTPPVSYSLAAKNLAIAEFSDDSSWLALVGWSDAHQDPHVGLWRLEDTPRRYVLRRRGDETNRIEFKSNWMATGSRYEGFGFLWDLSLVDRAVQLGRGNDEATNSIIEGLIAPVILSTDQRGFSQISFLPNGNTILTLDTAHRLRLFELEALGAAVKVWQIKPGSARVLRGHEGKITVCHVQAKTGLIVTAAEKESPRIWDVRDTSAVKLSSLTLDQLLLRASKVAGRNLTPAEWKEHFPGKPLQRTFENLQ